MEQLAVHHALLRVPVDSDGNHLVLTKVLYISDYSKQEELIDKINNSVAPAKRYDSNDPTTFIFKEPMVIDANRYLTWTERLPETHNKLDDYHRDFGEDLLLFPGEPRRMATVFPIEITDSYYENVLVVAPYKERAAVASVLLSMMESAQLQGYKVPFWTSKKSTVYQQIRQSCKKTAMLLATELESICEQIQMVKDRILHEYGDNVVLFLLGFESLLQDMSFLKPQSDNIISTVSDIIATDSDGDSLYYQPRDADAPDLLTQMELLLDGEESAAVSEVTQVKEEITAEKSTATSKVYDARQDLKYILTNGPKLGYHFVMIFGTAGELDSSKIDTNLFKHGVSFRDTKMNALTVLGHSDSNLPGLEAHCFRYSNGLDSYSYRPYLHSGLNWDGWTEGKNGEATFLKIEEGYLL